MAIPTLVFGTATGITRLSRDPYAATKPNWLPGEEFLKGANQERADDVSASSAPLRLNVESQQQQEPPHTSPRQKRKIRPHQAPEKAGITIRLPDVNPPSEEVGE